MARNEHKRQQKLAKRNKRASLVRKDLRKARNPSTLDIILSAANGPVLKCVSSGVIDGIVNLLVAKRCNNGQVIGVMFLVDTYCLGLKDLTLLKEFDLETYITRSRESGRSNIEVTLPYVAKLVNQAVEYARSIGFQPAQGYDAIQHIFDGVDINECTETFEFGKDGRPCYVSGPYDSAARQAMILSTLAQLGEGKYETVLVSGNLYDSHSCAPGCSHDHDHGGFIEDEFGDDYDLENDFDDDLEDETVVDAVDIQKIQ